jgi:LmbE family N-acetylglucosaminyl deacetylase
VLAIGAHSDDVEFGCGATLAKWASQGAEVHLLVLTDGSKGTWDPDADLAALVATRRREQEDAAAVLGLARIEFLGFPDGELESGLAERARVCEAIRRTRPDVVLGHDPWKRYRIHPDHRHAGWLLLDGVVAARDRHFFPDQGLAPHRPGRLLLFEAEEVDHLERVERHLDTKIRALLCHRSQWPSTMRIDAGAPDGDAQLEGFVGRVRAEAAAVGRAAEEGPAEGFKLLDKV